MKVLIKRVPKAKEGAAFSPEKAKKILREKNPTLRGHPITEKQRKWLGWQAGGGKADDGASITPLSNNVIQFNGPSHEQGGIPITYGNKKVEVEGRETGYKSPLDGSLHIMGNMTNPLTGRKFKEDSKRIADKERKVDSLIDYSTKLINENNPSDKWGQLAFNAGDVMLKGGMRKKGELGANKEWLATLQKTMLEHSNELGVDPQAFSKGTLTKAENGYSIKAQRGKYIAPEQLTEDTTTIPTPSSPYSLPSDSPLMESHVNEGFRNAFVKMMSDAPDFVRKGVSIGDTYRDYATQKGLYESGLQKWGPQGVRTRVAQPGKSAHQFGRAADMVFNDPKAKDWFYANANKYGIDFPLKKDDPNHMVYVQDLKNKRWTGPEALPNYGPEDQSTYTPDVDTFLKNLPKLQMEAPSLEEVQNKVTPGNYDFNIQTPQDYWKPSGASKLSAEQILPELYTAATNRQEPVWLQQYRPQLYQPYKVSFQDRLNQNQATFNALMKANAHNPSAQSVLAGQKYEADNQALAEEFRKNQEIEQDVVNKNISLLNDAQLKNLSLADTQYVRQAQTRSKVKEQNQAVLASIADKLHQHELENKTLQVYENLYPNYYFDEKNNMKLRYSGPNAGDWLNPDSTTPTDEASDKTMRITRDAKGNVLRSTSIEKSAPQRMKDYYQSLEAPYKTIQQRAKTFKMFGNQGKTTSSKTWFTPAVGKTVK